MAISNTLTLLSRFVTSADADLRATQITREPEHLLLRWQSVQ